jgi:hypothetical protein
VCERRLKIVIDGGKRVTLLSSPFFFGVHNQIFAHSDLKTFGQATFGAVFASRVVDHATSAERTFERLKSNQKSN